MSGETAIHLSFNLYALFGDFRVYRGHKTQNKTENTFDTMDSESASTRTFWVTRYERTNLLDSVKI